ncbi:MAG: YsnF/AvaK domain-containing protein [Anaerolineales bacterium]|nr:YsnF/AvaK domain-containing protein [Anaerolineales bacterium]MCB9128912.1 YsnF/AvaK domain-containing protein [Ardenticatenales bacterium]
MPTEYSEFLLVDKAGERATAYRYPGQSLVRVRLDDGREFEVEESRIKQARDGSYALPLRFTELAPYRRSSVEAEAAQIKTGDDAITIPVIEEALRVGKRTVETGAVRFIKRVREEEETVALPLKSESLSVTRVPIDRVVDQTQPIREEGSTLIIPIYEERLVVQKQLVLVEELHIDREVLEREVNETYTIRREEVVIDDQTTDQNLQEGA